MAIELIQAKTAPETSDFINVGDRETANLQVYGLTGAEVITVLQRPNETTTPEAAKEDGVLIQLTADNKTVSVKGPIQIAVDKPDTDTQEVSVFAAVKGFV